MSVVTSNLNNLNYQDYTILVIDDNAANVGVIANYLENYGFTVLVALNGHRGVERAQLSRPNLILMDVLMPEMDGFEACRCLKADPATHHIPIIFMTALSDTKSTVKAFASGGIDYITKPIQQEEILARITTQLRIQSLTQQLEDQNQQLQQRVKERTGELAEALDSLQRYQLQLVYQEKMSALGQLVAGIAHEINNPIGCISGNLTFANDYFNDLVHHLELYQKYCPHWVPEIQTHAKEIELDLLLEDLPKMMGYMQSAIECINNISTSLRTFSRADGESPLGFDIHEGLDSTLLLLQHRLKANLERPEIKVIKHYTSLPEIKCFPGPLNQVFMNILANAIDALEDSNQNRTYAEIKEQPNQITIQTGISEAHHNGNHRPQAFVCIRDNGIGMSQEIQKRIFEPSFTTKAVGKGTGLGLPIAREIIEQKHCGTLTCTSRQGQGTEFALFIPLV